MKPAEYILIANQPITIQYSCREGLSNTKTIKENTKITMTIGCHFSVDNRILEYEDPITTSTTFLISNISLANLPMAPLRNITLHNLYEDNLIKKLKPIYI